MKKTNAFNIGDIVVSKSTERRYTVVDLPEKNRSGYHCSDGRDIYLFFEDEIELVSEEDLRQEDTEFRQLERVYGQTQNHREELGHIFVKLIEEKGFSIEEWLGLQMEQKVLHANSQESRRFADDELRAVCGCRFKELVEMIRDN